MFSFVVFSWIALARILATSALVMGSFGRKVPSGNPLIHPFLDANVMNSAYHRVLSTSENPESTQVNS
jgi:hypothetical protein